MTVIRMSIFITCKIKERHKTKSVPYVPRLDTLEIRSCYNFYTNIYQTQNRKMCNRTTLIGWDTNRRASCYMFGSLNTAHSRKGKKWSSFSSQKGNKNVLLKFSRHLKEGFQGVTDKLLPALNALVTSAGSQVSRRQWVRP